MSRPAALAIAFASFSLATPAQASEKGWDTASDFGRNGLVIAAFVVPAVQDDVQGFRQALYSLGSTAIVTTALKETIHAERPDGSDDQSFPSGHTSISFAAAATLHKRHGWEVGLPAHAVAAFVGVARVKADKHFVRDVIAGAAIGEAAGWLLTSHKNDKVQWLPWADSKSGGVTVAMRF